MNIYPVELYTRQDAVNLILEEVENWDRCDMIDYIREILAEELESLEDAEVEEDLKIINPKARLEI